MLSAEHVDAGFHASVALCLLAAGLVVATGLALFLTGLSMPLKLALGLAVVLSVLDFVRRHGLRMTPDAVTAVRGTPRGVRVEVASGETVDGRIIAPIVVAPGFAAFDLDTAGGRRHVPVFADAMAPNAFRRLKVYLKLADHDGHAPT